MASVSIQRTEFPAGPRYKPICSECGMLRPGESGRPSPERAKVEAMAHLHLKHRDR